jgi:hypothetical protein
MVGSEKPKSIPPKKQWACSDTGTTVSGGPESLLQPDTTVPDIIPLGMVIIQRQVLY